MNKPITVKYENFKQELTNLINGSSLPFFVIENVLQNFSVEAKNIAKRQYEIDKAKYEEYLLELDKQEESIKNCDCL